MANLTITKIKTLLEPGMYADSPTLYLRVSPGGSKQWVQRLTINGRRQDLGLGGYPLRGIDDARKRAFDNRKVARDGGDPLHEKRQRDHVPTLRDAVQEVIKLNEGAWKNKGRTKANWESIMRDYVYPSLGSMRVSDIEARHVFRIVGPLWTVKNETAMRIKRRLSLVMQWAMIHGYRGDNPVEAVKVALPKVADTVKGNFKMLPHGEVGAAIAKTRASGAFPSTVAAFEFSVLTAARSQEVRGMTWNEVALDAATWEIPAERTKGNKAHRVPLSSRALDILREQKKTVGRSALVFPSPRSGMLSDSTISKLIRECGIDGVPHAIARASFRSWCADSNIAREVAESCLAHAVKGVEGRYQRSDLFERRRAVMEKWAGYLDGSAPAKVVNLR